MTTEIPSLYPDVVERATPPGKGEHGYYKRRSDGWIMTAGVWPSYKADMNFKGLDFLQQYGTFVYGTPWGDTNKDRRGVPFNSLAEPWRLILQSPGGAAEFPISQIIAYRWHIRPPYREAKFPQLEGLQIYDLFCPECDKGIFSAEREQEAIEMLRIHLISGFNDAHSYRPEDLQALGTEYGIDFFAPRRGRNQVRATESKAEAKPDPTDMTPTVSYRCKDCGAEFATTSERMRHGKSCPAKAAPVGSGS